jgi:hypothetical protein
MHWIAYKYDVLTRRILAFSETVNDVDEAEIFCDCTDHPCEVSLMPNHERISNRFAYWTLYSVVGGECRQ